jgi:hypothetical protein
MHDGAFPLFFKKNDGRRNPMSQPQSDKTEYQSGARVAIGIFGFIVGLTVLLVVLKLLLG